MNKVETLLSLIKTYDLHRSANTKYLKFFLLVGILVFAKNFVLTPLYGFYKHYLRPRINHKQRYGGNWVLVTGASDGVGEGLCYQFARAGFNVVVMGRYEQKVKEVADKIRKQYKRMADVLICNCETLNTIEGVEELYSQLDQIRHDICILINNVGTMIAQNLHSQSINNIQAMLNVNTASYAYFSKYFLRKFYIRYKKFGKRSALINICSMSGELSRPYISVYSGTKAFTIQFSKVLEWEYN